MGSTAEEKAAKVKAMREKFVSSADGMAKFMSFFEKHLEAAGGRAPHTNSGPDS